MRISGCGAARILSLALFLLAAASKDDCWYYNSYASTTTLDNPKATALTCPVLVGPTPLFTLKTTIKETTAATGTISEFEFSFEGAPSGLLYAHFNKTDLATSGVSLKATFTPKQSASGSLPTLKSDATPEILLLAVRNDGAVPAATELLNLALSSTILGADKKTINSLEIEELIQGTWKEAYPGYTLVVVALASNIVHPLTWAQIIFILVLSGMNVVILVIFFVVRSRTSDAKKAITEEKSTPMAA